MIFTPASLFLALSISAAPTPFTDVGTGQHVINVVAPGSVVVAPGTKLVGNVGPNSGHTARNSVGAGAISSSAIINTFPGTGTEAGSSGAEYGSDGTLYTGLGSVGTGSSSSSSSSFGSSVNMGGSVTINGDSSNCFQKCQGSTSVFESDGKCYCAAEAQKLSSCIFKVDPSWPLLPAKRPAGNCPSPIDDPTGFNKCIEDSIPHEDPNSQQVVRDCVKSTGVQATA